MRRLRLKRVRQSSRVKPFRLKAPVRLVLCCVAAVTSGLVGANAAMELTHLDRRGVSTTALVVSIPPSSTRTEGSFEARYTTRSGQVIVTDISRYYAVPALGDQIEIIYDPEDPKVAKTADSDDEPLLPIVGFGAISAVLLVFGLRRQRRPADQRPGQA
ncbi:MAG: hypothetical protein QOF10_4934 [Kribbellaceae bacterium]|nr:hypothetical protein [Kribbellaceae bacterium]